MDAKAKKALDRYEELGRRMSLPEVIADSRALQEAAREHSRLSPLVNTWERLEKVRRDIQGNRQIIESGADPELSELAASELDALETQREEFERELKALLVPSDPMDEKDTIMEIRAGTGGEEAALFAADLFRMYSHYIESRGWRLELISMTNSEHGGFKEVIFAVSGRGVYGRLRYESGVHRVQRVPATEASGRIHTSAATVAVLPEAEEVDIVIRPEDIKVDVFRSSGPGGQSVNTTDSAVRITHLPTKLVVSCQDEKSQLKNKNKAMKVLRSRLLDMKIQEAEAERARERRTQVGTGDRSAKIRTYNFPQSRLTDHRIGLTLHCLDDILNGKLETVIDSLAEASQAEKLQNED